MGADRDHHDFSNTLEAFTSPVLVLAMNQITGDRCCYLWIMILPGCKWLEDNRDHHDFSNTLEAFTSPALVLAS